jgi:hypothetical protein
MTDLLCNFADVKAGPDKIPTYDSEYGKLAGSICFDMDFPTYIRQAGVQETGWYFPMQPDTYVTMLGVQISCCSHRGLGMQLTRAISLEMLFAPSRTALLYSDAAAMARVESCHPLARSKLVLTLVTIPTTLPCFSCHYSTDK